MCARPRVTSPQRDLATCGVEDAIRARAGGDGQNVTKWQGRRGASSVPSQPVQDAIFCLFRSFRPKFYKTFCRSRQDLTIHARPVTRISETHLRNVCAQKLHTLGRCPAYAGKIIPHPGTLKGVPRMGELGPALAPLLFTSSAAGVKVKR